MATRLSQFLKEAPSLKPLVGRLERIGQLQRIYDETVPSVLARASRIGSIEGTTLIIIAFSGTVAAGLKQRLPSLLLQMQATEPQVTAIRVDVQLELTSANNPKKQRLILSTVALQSLTSLQATLPNSALKTALQRLLRDGGKQGRGLDQPLNKEQNDDYRQNDGNETQQLPSQTKITPILGEEEDTE